jgi:exodeoxyribonuclease III
MRVITFNANGIRSAARKGFFEWFMKQDADILCVQELKACLHHLDHTLIPEGYFCHSTHAEKKGYSGVAVYTRKKPLNVSVGLGFPVADTEGRYIQLEFDHLSVASLYLPSGSSGDVRQAVKMAFLKEYTPILAEKLKSKKPLIVCADWNIVHKKIDIKNWASNQQTSGCLPEERAWVDEIIAQGWVDAFRVSNQEEGQYSWWSQRSKVARANNAGWRIDYQLIPPALASSVQKAWIYKEQNFSDHAPVIIDYATEL